MDALSGHRFPDLVQRRLLEIDTLRSLAILAIVFAHLPYVFGEYPDGQSGDRMVFLLSTVLALFGLSTFFFLSGYSLYLHNNELRNGRQLARFFKKRWTRIYPLYWLGIVSIILLFASPISNLDYAIDPLAQTPVQNLATIIGVQAFINEGHTGEMNLWFVSVILSYYLIYGALVHWSNGIRRLVILSTAIFGLMLCTGWLVDSVDIRFYIYYWFFVGGIAAARSGNVFAGSNRKIPCSMMILGSSILVLYILAYRSLTAPGSVRVFIINESLGLLLLSSSIIVVGRLSPYMSTVARHIAERISFSTYSIFIFSLPILSVLAFLLPSLAIEGLARFLTILLGGVPLSIVVSYYVQVADSFLRVRLFKVQDLVGSQPRREKKGV